MRKIIGWLTLGLLLFGCQTSPLNTVGQSSGMIVGEILGLDGKPVQGVKVRAFLKGSTALTSPAHLKGSTAYRLLAEEVETEVTTDVSGRFAFKNPPEGTLNLEAVQSDDLKVFKSEVTSSKTQPQNVGKLNLKHTGTITGKVTAPKDPTVTNFEGVDVYIPGSSYLAKADSQGNYTLSNVAVGTFGLVATKTGLGRAALEGVAVQSKTTTSAPDLALELAMPKVQKIEPDNAGVGAEITITGENFGASSGETLQVSFTGAMATEPRRLDDNTIKVTVPEGANNGNVVVTVNGVTSNGAAFRALKTLTLDAPNQNLLRGSSFQYVPNALDSEGTKINTPTLKWEITSGNAVSLTNGIVSALNNGDAVVRVSSGNIAATRQIHVFSILGINLSTSSIELNAKPPLGQQPEAGYITSAQITPTVLASDNLAHGVTWETQYPQRVTVTDGLVETMPDAEEGEVIITATSVDDSRVYATASVKVTIYGDLGVDIQ